MYGWVKMCWSIVAKSMTNLGGLPDVLHATFHAQKGCRNGLDNGHTVVAQLILPSAFSIALEVKTPPCRS